MQRIEGGDGPDLLSPRIDVDDEHGPSSSRDARPESPGNLIDDDSDGEHPSSFAFKHRVKRPSRFAQLFSSREHAASSITLDTVTDTPREEPLFGDDESVADYPEFSNNDYLDGSRGGAIRRVVYDDLTAIGEPSFLLWFHKNLARNIVDIVAQDWIHEYNVERARKKHLSRDHSLLGQLKLLFDGTKVWIVLIATGIAVGVVAAAIDIASLWLTDIKGGHCKSSFYLSRGFCCWGLDQSSQCAEWITWAQSISAKSKSGAYAYHYFLFIIFSLLFAVSASILVAKYAPYARHSGIPEIKTVLGGFVIRRFLGTWTLLIKSLGLVLGVASGLWLGKEGPLVHVACCCANFFMKPFSSLNRNEARKREVLSAAAAAGISVAFGAPIGGVLFSLEQLSYYFPDKTMWRSFVSAMVAAVTLQAMNPFRTKKLVLYQVKYSRTWHDFELFPFAVLGIIGGIYGGVFIKLNMMIARQRKNTSIRLFPITEVVSVAILSSLINFPNVFMRIQTSELVAQLFQECKPKQEDFLGVCQDGKTAGPVVLLIFAALMGAMLSSLTFGIQLPAGIILPSMAIGALYGRAVGMVIQVWQRRNPTNWMQRSCEPDKECITPGVYAVVGAASSLGGVTRMTVAVVVIMFELTGALDHVLPIMVAVMLSKWVGDVFDKRGIYESWINFKEYPYLENRDDPVPDVPCSQVMTRIEDLVVITSTGHTIESLNSVLQSQTYKGFPVVSNTREAVIDGYISRSDLKYALEHAAHARKLPDTAECFFTAPPPLADSMTQYVDLRQWMDQTPITLPSTSHLQLAASLFQKLGLRYILLVNQGQLQGLITKKDAWFILNSSREFRTQEAPQDDNDLTEREARGLLVDSDGDDGSSRAASP